MPYYSYSMLLLSHRENCQQEGIYSLGRTSLESGCNFIYSLYLFHCSFKNFPVSCAVAICLAVLKSCLIRRPALLPFTVHACAV